MADFRSQAFRNLRDDPWNTVGGQGLLDALRMLEGGASKLISHTPIGTADQMTNGGVQRGMGNVVDFLNEKVGRPFMPVAQDSLDVASDLTGYPVPNETDLRSMIGIKPLPSRADGLGPVPEETSVRTERQGRTITGPTGRSPSGRSDMYAVGEGDTYQNQRGNFSKIGTTGIAERGAFERKKQQLMEQLLGSAFAKPNEHTGDLLKNLEQYAGGAAASGNERGAIGAGFLKPEDSAPPQEPDDGESMLPNLLMMALAAKFGGKAIGAIGGKSVVGKAGKFVDEALSTKWLKKGNGEKAAEKGATFIGKKVPTRGGKFGKAGVGPKELITTADKGRATDLATPIKNSFKQTMKDRASRKAADEATDTAMKGRAEDIARGRSGKLLPAPERAVIKTKDKGRTVDKAAELKARFKKVRGERAEDAALSEKARGIANERANLPAKRSTTLPAKLPTEGTSKPGSSSSGPSGAELRQGRRPRLEYTPQEKFKRKTLLAQIKGATGKAKAALKAKWDKLYDDSLPDLDK